MRRYELMLLLRPDLEDDKLQSAVEKVTRAIVNGGGSLSKVSPWGKRRLAYDIQNFREASYFLIHFDIEPSAVREIERGMLISEDILRHLVTLLEERPGTVDEEPAEAGAAGRQEQPGRADSEERGGESEPPRAEQAAAEQPETDEARSHQPDGEPSGDGEPEAAAGEPATSRS